MGVNEDLINTYKIKTQTYDEIQKSLVTINDYLYKATKLRGFVYFNNKF